MIDTSIAEKAQQIRLLALDVDGILTNGILFYGTNDISVRGFSLHDGFGIKLLQKSGVDIAIITAKSSDIVSKRARELNIEHIYQGEEEKLNAYLALKSKLQLDDYQIAYMGDDLPDLPLLRRVGLAITVPEAPALIKQHAHIVTNKPGGGGAVREICETLLEIQGHFDSVIQSYLT